MNKIAEDIKTGNFRHAYLLYGSEKYILRMYLNKLLSALGCSNENLNFTIFEGVRDADKIIEACETMPFFAERRTVLIEDSGLFKEKNDRITEYFETIPDYLTVIFAEKDVDKRSKLYKTVARYERVVEFSMLDDIEITDYILLELKKNKKRIRKSALDHFLNGAGTDIGFISCELEKLIAYSGDREEITLEDIDEICSPVTENRIFDMISEIASGRRSNALKKYNDLVLLREAPMKILALMERNFRQLLDIRQLYEKGQGEKLISEKLGIHPYAVKKNLPLARRYSEFKLKEILRELAAYDEDIKSGRISDRIAIELIMFSI